MAYAPVCCAPRRLFVSKIIIFFLRHLVLMERKRDKQTYKRTNRQRATDRERERERENVRKKREKD